MNQALCKKLECQISKASPKSTKGRLVMEGGGAGRGLGAKNQGSESEPGLLDFCPSSAGGRGTAGPLSVLSRSCGSFPKCLQIRTYVS